jgi:hypothetical protein
MLLSDYTARNQLLLSDVYSMKLAAVVICIQQEISCCCHMYTAGNQLCRHTYTAGN